MEKRIRTKVTEQAEGELAITLAVENQNQLAENEEVMELAIEEQYIEWKKIGSGSFYWGNKIIKPGQVFKARLIDIPKAFRDVVVPMNSVTIIPILPTDKSKSIVYTLSMRDDGLYDIVDKHHKRINENPMNEKDALVLLNAL